MWRDTTHPLIGRKTVKIHPHCEQFQIKRVVAPPRKQDGQTDDDHEAPGEPGRKIGLPDAKPDWSRDQPEKQQLRHGIQQHLDHFDSPPAICTEPT
ncbi:hypothetical protein [uncultured Ruegeria sp.]|uniref:hypothetical protein n=1 Tax=uncultured Ruegeria sp. TaxID=259304 RepID=UPI0026216A79|nr:hypothetical protein [uncultured Ruegeria sp.]